MTLYQNICPGGQLQYMRSLHFVIHLNLQTIALKAMSGLNLFPVKVRTVVVRDPHKPHFLFELPRKCASAMICNSVICLRL